MQCTVADTGLGVGDGNTEGRGGTSGSDRDKARPHIDLRTGQVLLKVRRVERNPALVTER